MSTKPPGNRQQEDCPIYSGDHTGKASGNLMTSEQLKAWRTRRGWTQAEAAAALHVPLRTYEGWERRFRPHHALDALTLYIDQYGSISPEEVAAHLDALTKRDGE